MLSATASHKAKHHTVSTLHALRRRLTIRMAIAILSVAMNPSAIFLQTLIGLVCYAYGLGDFGFNILNMFGCCCSVDQIRKHGSFWVKKRFASDELKKTKTLFWRVSFDNLNFKIKYAKKLCTSGPRKMLNLITAQVCCRQSYTLLSMLTQGGLAHLCITKLASSLNKTSALTADMFTATLLDPILSLYNKSIFKIVNNRLVNTNEVYLPIMIELRKCLPHYTPSKADIIIYASVQEAHSANKDDVHKYLNKLKLDLKDYPNHKHSILVLSILSTSLWRPTEIQLYS